MYDIDGREAVDRVRRVVSDSTKKASPDDSKRIQNENLTQATKSLEAKNQTRRSIIFDSPNKTYETTTLPAPQARREFLTTQNKPMPHLDSHPIKQQSKNTCGDMSRRGQFLAKRNEIHLARHEMKSISKEMVAALERKTSLCDRRIQGKLLHSVEKMPSKGEVNVLSPNSEEERLTYEPSKSRRQAKFLDSRLSTLSYISDASDNSYLVTGSAPNSSGIENSSEESSISYQMIDEHNDENEEDELDEDLSMSGSEISLDKNSFKQMKSSPEIRYKSSNDSNSTTQKSNFVNESINFTDGSTSLSNSSKLINTLTPSISASQNDRVRTTRKTSYPKMSLYTAQNFGTRQLDDLDVSSSESDCRVQIRKSPEI